VGDYDNYISEIIDEFQPPERISAEVIVIVAFARRCAYSGTCLDPREKQEGEAGQQRRTFWNFARRSQAHRRGDRTLQPSFTRALRSRALPYPNAGFGLELPQTDQSGAWPECPSYVTSAMRSFLSARRGTRNAWDARAWFESKQP